MAHKLVPLIKDAGPYVGNDYGDFWWVGHPALDRLYYKDEDPSTAERLLIDRRNDIVVIGGVEDKDANYSYDDYALIKLDNMYYLLNTCGCSCPSPSETWSVEFGPATLDAVRDYVLAAVGGLVEYQRDDFVNLIKAAEEYDKAN